MVCHDVPNNSYLWKIKVPFKIKVFLWLLHREAILTKDNLAKRNWNENIMCYFCDSYETIQHLFFECVLAKFIWRVIQITFGLTISWNMKHVFGDWIQRMNEKDRRLLYVGMDKNMGCVPKGRKSKISLNGMPVNGNHDDGYFCQAWMVI
jgi:hypothetical protein